MLLGRSAPMRPACLRPGGFLLTMPLLLAIRVILKAAQGVGAFLHLCFADTVEARGIVFGMRLRARFGVHNPA